MSNNVSENDAAPTCGAVPVPVPVPVPVDPTRLHGFAYPRHTKIRRVTWPRYKYPDIPLDICEVRESDESGYI